MGIYKLDSRYKKRGKMPCPRPGLEDSLIGVKGGYYLSGYFWELSIPPQGVWTGSRFDRIRQEAYSKLNGKG